MIATALSKVNNKIWTIRRNPKRGELNETPWFRNNTSDKLPAIILAARRTAKVPGRMTFLLVSIRTLNGINTRGVLVGTKWGSIWIVLLSHPYSIKDNQSGKARPSAITKCLNNVKM